MSNPTDQHAQNELRLPLYNTHTIAPHDSNLIAKSRSHTPKLHHENDNDNFIPLSNITEASRSSTPNLEHDHDHSSRPLPKEDRPQFIILAILYLIQGVPIGLLFGSIPFMLKSSNLSYSQVGIFSLASYPYSFKLFYSPIVDSLYSQRFGRRKSWIIPVQFISGLMLIVLSYRVQSLMQNIQETLGQLTFMFFVLIFLCATQDIAVDGWALTILSPQLLSFASTAQTVGLNCGYFLSFTVFLAFSSPEFANKYFRTVPSDLGLISLPQYLRLCGTLFIVVTLVVAFLVPEHPKHFHDAHNTKRSDDIELGDSLEGPIVVQHAASPVELDASSPLANLKSVYVKMYQVLKLSNVKIFIVLHLISKIGFQTNEALTNLKLLEKGFKKEDLAITVLIDFPFEMIFSYYAGRWSTGDEPLRPWLYLFLGRIFSAFCGQILVWCFPSSGEIGSGYFLMVILQHLMGSFMSTIQFVSICAFHTRIADPLIGGTYMTTLNTLSNLGGQWPKIIVLYLIDRFTILHCVPVNNGEDALLLDFFQDKLFYQCNKGDLKQQCLDAGGSCHIMRDGYYYTNIICITVGLLTYFLWIKKTAKYLQALPARSWRVKQL